MLDRVIICGQKVSKHLLFPQQSELRIREFDLLERTFAQSIHNCRTARTEHVFLAH